MTLGSNEYTAHAAVIEGVVEALDLLKKRNAGRYTTQDRITQEVLLGAAVGVAKGKVLSSVARLLNVANRSQTALANGRVEVYESEFLCVVDWMRWAVSCLVVQNGSRFERWLDFRVVGSVSAAAIMVKVRQVR